MTSTSSTTSSTGLTQISGLASGIDTSSLISSLMAVAAGPQNLLKSKLATAGTKTTALQGLNTQGASLLSAASTLTSSSAWMATSATSSDTSVSASTTGLPIKGSLTFDVTQLATPQTVATGLITSDSTKTASFDLQDGSGKTLASISSTMDATAIAKAVNNSGAPVTATVVHSSDGDRVLMTSKSTGDGSVFSLSDSSGQITSTTLTGGHNAQLDLGGTVVSSPTNTFSNLMSGVNVTVTKLASQVTVSVGQDTTGITSQVSSLMTSLNSLLSGIATQTKASVSASSGTVTNSSGPLVGDWALQNVGQSLLNTVSTAVGGQSLASAGIQVNADGTVDFDQDAFSSLMSSDPSTAQRLIQGLASSLKTVATAASDPIDGSITREIASDNSEATDLTSQISDWDQRLAIRQQTLTSQFTAMETAMSTLSSQGTALSQMISSLSSS